MTLCDGAKRRHIITQKTTVIYLGGSTQSSSLSPAPLQANVIAPNSYGLSVQQRLTGNLKFSPQITIFDYFRNNESQKILSLYFFVLQLLLFWMQRNSII